LARPFRYTFILVLVAVCTAMAAVGGWHYARASSPVSGPIILISVDTLRADRLSVYGGSRVRTPTIEALAADGVVFERAYTHSPQTLPAHASMLSGRLPFRTGVRDNVGFAIGPNARMIAEVLRDRDYRTAGIVSSYVLRKETGIGQGFEFFDGELTAEPSAAVEPLQRDGAEAVQVAERWLATAGTERVFLFLHLYEPHTPYAADERYAEYSPYEAEVAYADDLVGRFVHYLKSHQLYDRSTIILVSDHGEGFGDHGEQEHGLLLHEESLRVPLIIKPAAGEGGGRRVAELVQLVDLMPTIVDFAKAPLPGGIDGRSLRPLLAGTNDWPERLVYSESFYGRYHFGWSELTSVTDGRHRYIRAPREELYDLERDPAEQINLAEEHPQETARFRNVLQQLDAAGGVPQPDMVQPQERRLLESLGYVGDHRASATGSDEPPPDPKDKVAILDAYREAVALNTTRRWFDAIDVLERILRKEPGVADLWRRLGTTAALAARYEQAAEAYRRAAALEPDDASAPLGAAEALLELRRLDAARIQGEGAAATAAEHDPESLSAAHGLLARIALARRDATTARTHAELAREAAPGLPMPEYVEGRLLYDRKRYAEALPFFEQAVGSLAPRDARQQIADLHFHTADTLVRLKRYEEAEREFLAELASFPLNGRTRAGLATLYRSTGRLEEADQVLADLVNLEPTPETYRLAARLWTTFGNPRRAADVRAEGARAFSPGRARVRQ
jgi:arylsulfatase A-like enzyme/Flp pilus assembly protein TadD